MQHAACGSSDACCSWAFSILSFNLHLAVFFFCKFKQILLKMIEKIKIFALYLCYEPCCFMCS
jgi:hypothetical protein